MGLELPATWSYAGWVSVLPCQLTYSDCSVTWAVPTFHWQLEFSCLPGNRGRCCASQVNPLLPPGLLERDSVSLVPRLPHSLAEWGREGRVARTCSSAGTVWVSSALSSALPTRVVVATSPRHSTQSFSAFSYLHKPDVAQPK